jgi:hypothetical protein
LLRSKTGHDFAGYKVNTMRRRIERRMKSWVQSSECRPKPLLGIISS